MPSVPPVGDALPFVPPLCAVFRRFLKGRGLKFTVERAVILDSVLAREGVFEAEELLAELKQSHPEHRVSKATVYRTLKHLIEAGIIGEVLLDSSRAHYQLTYGRPKVGHLVDVHTNRVVEFPADALDPLIQRICREHGMEPISCRFVIYASGQDAER
jgi:Fur family ferric uptake transcriptional regulator